MKDGPVNVDKAGTISFAAPPGVVMPTARKLYVGAEGVDIPPLQAAERRAAGCAPRAFGDVISHGDREVMKEVMKT